MQPGPEAKRLWALPSVIQAAVCRIMHVRVERALGVARLNHLEIYLYR